MTPGGAPPPQRKPAVYSVSHPALDAAREAMVAVCDANLPGEHHLARYDWYYSANPLGRGDVFLLSAADGAGAPTVVGCTGMAPRQYVMNAASIRAVLSADFAVDKDHRTVLPAIRLQRAAYDEGRAHADLLYGFPNFRAVGVFERVGYRVLGRMQRYVRVLDYTRYVRKRRGLSAVASLVGPMLNLAERALAVGRAVPGSRAVTFRWVSDFDARFDALGRQMTTQAQVVGLRTADWLKWRYSPVTGTEVLVGVLERSANLLAYAVVTRKGGTARIADFGGSTPQDLSALFHRLPPALRRKGFEAAEVYFLGPAWVETVLGRHRFTLRDAERAVVIAPGASNLTLPADARSWYLTWMDADT